MQIFNWLGTFTLPNLYHSDRLLIVLRPFHLHYILLCGYIMAVTTLNLHHKLGKLARNISQILSADVEVTVNIQFKKNTMYLTNVREHSIPESENFGSAHRVVSLAGFPNPESPSAEDADELKTAELFPKARITYN
uniref:Bm659 n=1 Tax=Brugia malayi TaxID=6279 RepID=A0A0H5SAU5_BRUMA|nr:Bm659 [Brugia malayi]